MPLYEYRCQLCGERFEKLIRSSTTPSQVVCPTCASAAVERAFSTFATAGGAPKIAETACAPAG